jgi:CMP-N,N'-diacetyllegionaminic acid synthase
MQGEASEATLGVIPARGGSKGIPDKNLATLCGRPLIGYTIQAALASQLISRVIVSTEDERIAEAARQAGAEVPFRRSAELASDSASNLEVFIDAIQRMRRLGFDGPWAVLLQPSSPLRTAEDIDRAGRRMVATGAEVVLSVTEAEPHPWLAMQADAKGWIRPAFFDGAAQPGRQQYPPMYYLNGAIYLVKIDSFLARGSMYGPKTAGYVMPRERSMDINEPLDLQLCELLMRRGHGRTTGDHLI